MSLFKQSTNNRYLLFLLFNVILPIIVGGFIYFIWRKDTLLMFEWFKYLGFDSLITSIRLFFSKTKGIIPNWILFSFPDGLWVYSFSSFLGFIWLNSSRKQFVFWFSIGPILGIGSEVGQFLGLIQGTFCISDLIFYFLAAILSLLILKINYGGKNNEFKFG